jgi:transposase, IS5 family
MIRDRYDPVNLFRLVPHLQFEMEPTLVQLDHLLDDDVLVAAVKADLSRRYPRSTVCGRRSTPVEVILRMLVLKHLHHWSYEATEQFVNDSLVLRQFCRLGLHKAPDDTTLLRWANRIQPATLHALNDRVVALAQTHRVTRGRKLRVDGTVVETTIHYPSDSSLLGDGVRVLCRTLGRARAVLQGAAGLGRQVFRDRTRSALQHVRRIAHTTRQRGDVGRQARTAAYAQLVATTQQVVAQAQQVLQVLTPLTSRAAQCLADRLATVVPRVQQVIAQTQRRVFHGEVVPASEKLVSLFEPHTAIIRKGKPRRPTEFGRLVWLDEVDGGIISRYAVLDGNPDEATHVAPSVAHHKTHFGHAPRLVVGDRATHSADGERAARTQGVRHVVLPKPGAKSAARIAHEQQDWFRRGTRWRAGIEGRISGLKRRHGLDRCRYHGAAGMERWVGWGVIAHDLRVIARKLAT